VTYVIFSCRSICPLSATPVPSTIMDAPQKRTNNSASDTFHVSAAAVLDSCDALQ
jgi:hypothetical protein